jgi:hypothetical protein
MSACPNTIKEYIYNDSQNEAFYPGKLGDYISVCEKVTGVLGTLSRVCNPASCDCNTAFSGNITNDNLDNQTFYVGNNSPYTHKIEGFATINAGAAASAGGLPTGTAGVTSVTSAQKLAFPALSRAATADGAPPATTVSPEALALGANPRLARRVLDTPRGEQLYIVPANGWVCLASSDNAVDACSPSPAHSDNEIVGVTSVCAGKGELEFAALLPGAPQNAVVRFSDGTQRRERVRGGALALYVPRSSGVRPLALSWSDAGRTLIADTGAPDDADLTTCAAGL